MIAILQYGAGNTKSVMNALHRLNADFILTDDKEEILSADKVIFPGVGHARHAMDSLRERQLDDVIRKVQVPLLGICVGMQLLYAFSEEGETECLGIVPGNIKKFNDEDLIVPQIGWHTIQYAADPLFEGLDENPWFYSVHSYYAECSPESLSISTYGVDYCSTVKKDNYYGVQFHPEKSSKNGGTLLKNFLQL